MIRRPSRVAIKDDGETGYCGADQRIAKHALLSLGKHGERQQRVESAYLHGGGAWPRIPTARRWVVIKLRFTSRKRVRI